MSAMCNNNLNPVAQSQQTSTNFVEKKTDEASLNSTQACFIPHGYKSKKYVNQKTKTEFSIEPEFSQLCSQ